MATIGVTLAAAAGSGSALAAVSLKKKLNIR
jgi:hypothetical protein